MLLCEVSVPGRGDDVCRTPIGAWLPHLSSTLGDFSGAEEDWRMVGAVGGGDRIWVLTEPMTEEVVV